MEVSYKEGVKIYLTVNGDPELLTCLQNGFMYGGIGILREKLK